MEQLGQEKLTLESLLEEVILQSHTFNYFTVYTTMAEPANNDFRAYGLNSNNLYVF